MNQYDRLFKMLEAKISTKKISKPTPSNAAPQSGQSAKDTLVPLGTPPKSVSDREHSQRQGTIQLKKAAKKITGSRKSKATEASEERKYKGLLEAERKRKVASWSKNLQARTWNLQA